MVPFSGEQRQLHGVHRLIGRARLEDLHVVGVGLQGGAIERSDTGRRLTRDWWWG